jgi:hypothetical protein
MSTIVTRSGKGSPLTHTEVDNNFTNLNTDKYQSGNNASFGTLSASGAFSANGGTTLGDASGDALTINSSAVSIPNGLNFDSNTFVIDATNNRVGVGTASPTYQLDVQNSGNTLARLGGSGVGQAGIYIQSGGAFSPFVSFSSSISTVEAGMYAVAGSAALVFTTTSAGSERMRITSAGNVGIGTSSPTNAKLVVSSGGAGGAIMSVDTTSTTSFVRLLGDFSSQNLLNWQAGTVLRFATSNQDYSSFVERMRIDSSGNLGLGVTPSAWATITALQNKNAFFGGYSNTSYLGANTYYNGGFKYIASSGACRYDMDGDSVVHRWYIAPSGTAGNAITFTQAMTLDASGRLGVGTTSPTQLFQVRSASTDPYILIGGDARDCGLMLNAGTEFTALRADSANRLFIASGSGEMRFSTNGSERMRIDSSGNVGIGTSSPAQKLHVAGSIQAGTASTTSGSVYLFNSSNDTRCDLTNTGTEFKIAATYLTTGGYKPITFYTSDAERMRINSDGDLLLNTTTKNNDGLLSISADSDLHQGITIKEISTANNIYYIYFTNSSGSGAGRIEHTGATTVSYVTSSDARLKTNIVDAGSAKQIIEAIQIREFDWVSGEHQKFGVVAQELVEVAPEAVSIGRAEDDSWGVDYSKLVPHLIKYVQELNAKVTALEAQINQ